MTYPLPARRPAGDAGGALDGRYPDDLAIGVPLVFGAGAIMDEFLRPPDGTYYGDLLWGIQNFAVSPAVTNQTPTADTELGIARLSTGACGANEGASIGYNDGTDRTFYRAPPPGSVYAVKMRAVDVTQITISSGFYEAHTGVSGATSNDFLGIRGVGGANWFGVVRNGTAESTVDLGIAVGTTWGPILGFKREASGAVQFCRFDRAGRDLVVREDIGSAVSTNLPNVALAIAPLSVVSLDGIDKRAEIDFMCLGGRTER